MVGSEGRLKQPVVAESRLVYPLRIRYPRPIQAEYLGAGVNIGEPLRLQFGKIFHRPGVVAEEIHSADRVPLVHLVVNLADHVVRADAVRKTIVDGGRAGGIEAVVRRKSLAVAGD